MCAAEGVGGSRVVRFVCVRLFVSERVLCQPDLSQADDFELGLDFHVCFSEWGRRGLRRSADCIFFFYFKYLLILWGQEGGHDDATGIQRRKTKTKRNMEVTRVGKS